MAKMNEEVLTSGAVNTVAPNAMDKILARLENLESENKALKEKSENMFTKAKKKYEGPRHYSYKLWSNVPVLSYISIKKDGAKDLLFKNQYGEYVSNHLLELTLADGKTIKVDVNEFNNSYQRSDKMPAEVLSDGSNPT